jgi:sugar phosphate isomerase/epimerase
VHLGSERQTSFRAVSLSWVSEVDLPGIRIGIQLAGLRLPFKQALRTAARLGVEAVEIDARTELRPSELVGTGLRQVRKMLEDLNLRVAAVRYATRRGYEITEELDRRIEGTKRAMKMAYELGANVVVNHVGAIESDPAHPSREVLRSVLGDLGVYSQKIGAFLACETGAEPLSVLGQLIDSLPEGSVGITLNPGNLLVNGFDLDDLAKVARHVMLVHAKDGVPDRARGRGTQVPLGYGLAEFPNIVATLEEHAYRGYFVVERDLPANPIEEFRTAIEFLSNM